MAKKRFTEKQKETITLAVIVVSVIVCIVCVGGDLFTGLKETNWSDTMIGEAVSDIDEVAGVFDKTQEELNLDNIQDKLNEEFNDEFLSDNNANQGFAETTGLAEATVIKVISGSNLLVDIQGEETTVRFIGVFVNEDGRKAVENKLSAGKKIFLEYDATKTDEYGRRLAYVYFANGDMVQEWLLQNGYAEHRSEEPNTKYDDRFASIK